MRKLNILLIEDNQNDLFIIEAALKRIELGYTVTIVHDGRQAITYLETLGTELPHLILLNLDLPSVSGADVRAYIRMQSHLRRIPLVIISGFEKPTSVNEDVFVPKMSNFGDFVIRLQRAITRCLAAIQV